MAADVNPDSADTSTLTKTVTGVKPNLDPKATVKAQPEEKVTREVEGGNGCDTGCEPEKKVRLQRRLSNCIEINCKTATPPWPDFEH